MRSFPGVNTLASSAGAEIPPPLLGRKFRLLDPFVQVAHRAPQVAAVGHDQRRPMKECEQVSDRSGVAREVNTARVSAMLHDGAAKRPVFFQPNDPDRMAITRRELVQRIGQAGQGRA